MSWTTSSPLIFTDTMFASARAGKSQRNFTCVQVFASDFGWIHAIPMESEAQAHKAFKMMFKDVGVPKKLIMDGAKAQVEGKSKQICDQVG